MESRNAYYRNIVIAVVAVAAILSVLGWKILSISESKIENYTFDETLVADSTQYILAIQNLEAGNNLLLVKGIIIPKEEFVDKNEIINTIETNVIARNIQTGECYNLPTVMEDIEKDWKKDKWKEFKASVPELANYKFTDTTETLCGFYSYSHTEIMNTSEYDYELYLSYKVNGTEKLVLICDSIKSWGDSVE